MPIGTEDVWWTSLALVCGFAARQVGLPPMNGFLVAGFIDWGLGQTLPEKVQTWSDFGLILMLFCIGLKLQPRSLLAPSVWGVASLHMVISFLLVGSILAIFVAAEFSIFANLSLLSGCIIAFSLTFSSTVLAIKTLSESGELASPHGQLSINVLVMQDIAAVVFLGLSAGKVPSPWAPLLVFLLPARRVVAWLLEQMGHGELLVVFGFVLAISASVLFELVKLKGDLGALIVGSLLASHPKAIELKHELTHFQDLFLVGFFLMVGAEGLTFQAVGLGILLTLLLPVKGILWQLLFQLGGMSSRTAFTTTLSLFSYSEFALITMAYAVKQKMISGTWVSVVAVSVTCSFVVSAVCEKHKFALFDKIGPMVKMCDRTKPIEEIVFDHREKQILVIGLGPIGQSVYKAMSERQGKEPYCLDFDENVVKKFREQDWPVIHGDAADPETWQRFGQRAEGLFLVMTTMSHSSEVTRIAQALKAVGYQGHLASLYKKLLPSELKAFMTSTGATLAVDCDEQSGVGFAEQVIDNIDFEPLDQQRMEQYKSVRRQALRKLRSRANERQRGLQVDIHDDDANNYIMQRVRVPRVGRFQASTPSQQFLFRHHGLERDAPQPNTVLRGRTPSHDSINLTPCIEEETSESSEVRAPNPSGHVSFHVSGGRGGGEEGGGGGDGKKDGKDKDKGKDEKGTEEETKEKKGADKAEKETAEKPGSGIGAGPSKVGWGGAAEGANVTPASHELSILVTPESGAQTAPVAATVATVATKSGGGSGTPTKKAEHGDRHGRPREDSHTTPKQHTRKARADSHGTSRGTLRTPKQSPEKSRGSGSYGTAHGTPKLGARSGVNLLANMAVESLTLIDNKKGALEVESVRLVDCPPPTLERRRSSGSVGTIKGKEGRVGGS